MTPQLTALVEEAYHLFARYPLGEAFVVCTGCCLSEAGQMQLRQTPLRDISEQLMFYYLDAAVSANDAPELTLETKYFLPRILELMAQRAF